MGKPKIPGTMKRLLILLTISNLAFSNAFAQDKYIANTEKTQMLWLGEKVTGQHTGTIKLQSGWLTLKDRQITGGEFLIDMKTLEESEDNQKFEGHMSSDDFFSVDKYSTSKLVITGSTPFDKGTATVNGNLTIKDIPRPIEFKAAMQEKEDGLWFFSNIVVDRTQYGIRYGSGSFFENLGDKTIYDDFKLKISLLVNKQ